MITTDPFDDKLREECGVFGIHGYEDAAAHTALGQRARQHRGEEAVLGSCRRSGGWAGRVCFLLDGARVMARPGRPSGEGQLTVLAINEEVQWLF